MPVVYDDAVVGAGILGLAHAYHLARRGRRVLVLERGERATGASIRNFGMLWPIGQPSGYAYHLARRSLALWQEVLHAAALWYDPVGSLHLAYRDDELAVLREFAALAGANGVPVELLAPAEVLQRSDAVWPVGLLGALWSPTEICVDPRQIIRELPGWLHHALGVHFEFNRAVAGYADGRARSGSENWRANRLWVCAGDDIRTLYPEVLSAAGLVRCKLQMLRTPPLPQGRRLGPMFAGGLTLRHYGSFASCPSLPALRRRVAEETPEYDRYGIHVLVSQTAAGELTLGDSHEYGDAIQPFNRAEIDDLILGYLRTFLAVREIRITERWSGYYAKHPTHPYLLERPEPRVALVTGVGGAGMTLSFGLAEQTVRQVLEEEPDGLAD